MMTMKKEPGVMQAPEHSYSQFPLPCGLGTC
jgi:hypothetical protein